MTVLVTAAQQDFTGNGATTDFSPNFAALLNSDIVVKQIVAGVTSTLVSGVGYNIIGDVTVLGGGWFVRCVVAPAVATTIHIERTEPITQVVSFRTQGSFSPAIHEAALDKACMIDQQLDRRLSVIESGGNVGTATAGNGLLAAGTVWNVVGGNGIIANAHDVALDLTGGAPVNVTKSAASAGASTKAALADHKHDVSTAAAVALTAGGANAEGAATTLARSDHTHAIATAAPVNVTKGAASAGVAATFAASDHKHDITTAAAVDLTDATSAEGAAVSMARSDHTHSHGARAGGTLHAVATSVAAGFMPAADKLKLDSYLDTYTGITNVRTTDATPTDIVSWTMTDQSCEFVEVSVVGEVQAAAAGAGGVAYKFLGTYRRKDGAVAAVTGSPTVLATHEDGAVAAFSAAFNLATPVVSVRVTGAAATVVEWTCMVRRIAAI